MEKGIQCLMELAVLEIMRNIYLDGNQLSHDPDDMRCPQSIWQRFVWSTPPSYATTLAAMTWKNNKKTTADEVSSLLQQYEENLSPYTRVSCRKAGSVAQRKSISFLPNLYKPVSQLLEVSVPVFE